MSSYCNFEQVWFKLFLKKLYGPFYGWGSTASRLQSHFEQAVYFFPLSSQKFLVLILSTSEGWKAEPSQTTYTLFSIVIFYISNFLFLCLLALAQGTSGPLPGTNKPALCWSGMKFFPSHQKKKVRKAT